VVKVADGVTVTVLGGGEQPQVRLPPPDLRRAELRTEVRCSVFVLREHEDDDPRRFHKRPVRANRASP
jgi:hypothetical protein